MTTAAIVYPYGSNIGRRTGYSLLWPTWGTAKRHTLYSSVNWVLNMGSGA